MIPINNRPKGTYLLIFHLATTLSQVPIGRLGRFDFNNGYYLYIGSAFGSGGLPARLAHHQQRTRTNPHWHLDYLRPYLRLQEAWSVACALRMEPIWCMALAAIPRLTTPIRGFGASDSPCPAHLFYATDYPGPRTLSHSLFTCLPVDHPDAQNVHIDIQHFKNTT
jgi:Uri superfamily endonuclease